MSNNYIYNKFYCLIITFSMSSKTFHIDYDELVIKLKIMFPNVESNTIKLLLSLNNYNFDLTLNALLEINIDDKYGLFFKNNNNNNKYNCDTNINEFKNTECYLNTHKEFNNIIDYTTIMKSKLYFKLL